MSEYEEKLLELIRENDKPEQALMTAAVIVLGFLKQRGSSGGQDPSVRQVLC